jgi:hypothetical protein
MKRLIDNPEVRYLLRQKSHTLGMHGEAAVNFRAEIQQCLESGDCDYDRLIGTLESYRVATWAILDLIGDLVSMLQVMKAVSDGDSTARGKP